MSTDLGLTLQDVALIHRYSGIQEKEVLLPVSQSDEQSRQLIDGGREEERKKERKERVIETKSIFHSSVKWVAL